MLPISLPVITKVNLTSLHAALYFRQDGMFDRISVRCGDKTTYDR